jgi:hypothetical protein
MSTNKDSDLHSHDAKKGLGEKIIGASKSAAEKVKVGAEHAWDKTKGIAGKAAEKVHPTHSKEGMENEQTHVEKTDAERHYEQTYGTNVVSEHDKKGMGEKAVDAGKNVGLKVKAGAEAVWDKTVEAGELAADKIRGHKGHKVGSEHTIDPEGVPRAEREFEKTYETRVVTEDDKFHEEKGRGMGEKLTDAGKGTAAKVKAGAEAVVAKTKDFGGKISDKLHHKHHETAYDQGLERPETGDPVRTKGDTATSHHTTVGGKKP